MLNKIGCVRFVIFSLILISSTARAALDVSDLTEEENLALYEELLNQELDSDTSMSPEQKQIVQMKWNKVKDLVQEHCQYFHLGTNLTNYLVKIYNCMEKFGYEDRDINDMSPKEYVSEVCDNDNWREFVECGLQTTQTLVLSFFRCFMGVDYEKPGGLGDAAKYAVLERIPELLDLFWKFACANKDFMLKSAELKEESKELRKIMERMKMNNDPNAKLRLGMCFLQRTPEAAGRTICEHFANIDYKTTVTCLSETEEFQNPRARETLQKYIPLFKFIIDKNTGGPTKAELMRNVWNDFCAPGSYLATIFNKRTSPGSKSKDGAGTKKSSIIEPFGLLDVVIKLSKVTLTSEQEERVEAKLKKAKFVPPPPDSKNETVVSRVAKFTDYYMKMYGCLDTFGFDNPEEFRDDFCDAENWSSFQTCALWPTQSFVLSNFYTVISDMEKHVDLEKPIQAVKFALMKTIPEILNAIWKLLCQEKKALMGIAGFKRTDTLLLKYMMATFLESGVSNSDIQSCYAKHSSLLERGDRSYCEHFSESDYLAGLNCILDGIKFDVPSVNDLWKKLVTIGKVILDKNESAQVKMKLGFVNTIWKQLCSQESPFSVILNQRNILHFDEDSSHTATEKTEQTNQARDEL